MLQIAAGDKVLFNVAVGFTVIENTIGEPVQVFDAGVTTITAVTGVLLTLVTVNALMVPVPAAARPIEVVVFVQL